MNHTGIGNIVADMGTPSRRLLVVCCCMPLVLFTVPDTALLGISLLVSRMPCTTKSSTAGRSKEIKGCLDRGVRQRYSHPSRKGAQGGSSQHGWELGP